MLKKILYHPQSPFWILAAAIVIILTLPVLIQDGMFMDAMLYTSVSHNLSMGIGTFWFPQFSNSNIAGLSSFHEQPPLVFGIQSLFYKVLGDSMYVERIYTFFTTCCTVALIIYLWQVIYKNYTAEKKLAWIAVIFWITIPVCFWSYANNMHENTMGIFTLIAVIFVYQAFQAQSFAYLYLILCGIAIFLATLSKGIPGFFPITVPALYWLFTKKISFGKAVLQSIIITMIPILIYALLWLFPMSQKSLSIYLFQRVLHRINEDPTVTSRFYILGRLFMELIPQLSIVLMVFAIARFKQMHVFIAERLRESLFFCSIGIAASAPLMLTLVQKGFYFVPALPFFAIGLSILIAPVIAKWQIHRKKANTIFVFASLVLFVGSIGITALQYGKRSRNKDLLHDVYTIGNHLQIHSTISIPEASWNQWDLQCYLIRYYNISVEKGYQRDYCIVDKTMETNDLSAYKKIDLSTIQYDLYERGTKPSSNN
jgi:4-amino-4-deoxy-L-arabinose transferase-like glycosyltransferase